MTAPLLETEGLSFSYDGGFALNNLSLRIAAGQCVALAGPNGAGKSTLLKLLAGILKPSAGVIRFEGEDASGSPRQEARRWAQRVAWVPQDMDALFPVSVEELVRMGFFPRSGNGGWTPPPGASENLETLLAQFNLGPLRRRDVRSLSGGERRRALLARGLAQGARILLLDEPAAHLDPRHQVELSGLIARLCQDQGVAVLVALHDLNLALTLSNRVLLLAGGKLLAEGTPTQVFTPGLLERAYGLSARVLTNDSGNPIHIDFSAHSGGIR